MYFGPCFIRKGRGASDNPEITMGFAIDLTADCEKTQHQHAGKVLSRLDAFYIHGGFPVVVGSARDP
jgi:hypothetical protein